MNAVTFLVKPASGLCDLCCRYCFYDDVSDRRQVKSMGLMTQETASRLIDAGFEAVQPGGTVQYLFQGGEPTLVGLDWLRAFVQNAKDRCPPGVQLCWSIQTNGMCLDEQWCAFFREHGFLVGLSVDGTRGLHDRFRLDPHGKGTWRRAVQALEQLDKSGVETNLLCVVTGPAACSPHKLYSALRSLGEHPLQLIPCLDPMENSGAMDYSLAPRDYGRFLCSLFDCWYRDWAAGIYVSIRVFDDYLRLMLGMEPGSCASAGHCGNYLVVEGDGGLYPCDFFVLDEWRMGSIWENTVRQALVSPAGRAFQAQGARRPPVCKTCVHEPLCRGGCPRDWDFSGPEPVNRYCEAFRCFFDYAAPRLRRVARQLSAAP